MEVIQVTTRSRIEFVDMTSRIRELIAASKVSEGIAVVCVLHTTAGITINEAADPSVVIDVNHKLSQLVPYQDSYRHMEGNSDAHIKASIMGSSINLVISGGKPVLGTWQGVFFCEFDGPRSRKAIVKIIPG